MSLNHWLSIVQLHYLYKTVVFLLYLQLSNKPHEWKYIMYMRNLFLLPFVALVLVFDLKRGMTNLLKMGWGGKESITVVVWCFFLLCLVSIIEKGEQELMITWDLDVFCNKGLQNISLLLYMCYFLVKICGCVRFWGGGDIFWNNVWPLVTHIHVLHILLNPLKWGGAKSNPHYEDVVTISIPRGRMLYDLT